MNKPGEIMNQTDTEVDEKNPIFQRSIETKELIKILKTIKVDDEITYETLSKAAMGDCSPHGIKHSYLASARNILRKETGLEFAAIANVGLKHMTDSDKIRKSKKALPTHNRRSKKEMARLASVNYDQLSPEEQLCHNVNMSILNVIKCSSSGDKVNKVRRIIGASAERLALEETLEMFR